MHSHLTDASRILALFATALALCPIASHADDEVLTRVYKVPPSFIQSGTVSGTESADPFSDGGGGGIAVKKSSREILESVGIMMPEGASAVYNPETGELIVRNTEDQHELVEAYLESLVSSAERQVHVIVEFIEVFHEQLSDWLFENRMQGDGTELREVVQEWVRSDEATILETAMVTARSGQRAKVESVSEWIYPTEYDPSEIPADLELGGGSELSPTPPNPAAFECRNLGLTLEVDPVIGADDTTIDLNLAPELVELEDYNEWPHEDAEDRFRVNVPTFYTMKVTTQVTLIDGRYAFLGTMRPLRAREPSGEDVVVLGFVRADLGVVQTWSVREADE